MTSPTDPPEPPEVQESVPPQSGRVTKFRAKPVLLSSRDQKVGLLSGPTPTYPSGKFFAIGGVLIALVLAAYRILATRDLDRTKAVLLDERAALEQELGREWFSLRDEIENVVVDASKRPLGEEELPAAPVWDFRSRPGLYFRALSRDVRTVAAVRSAALVSKRDGFVGCLLRPQAATDAGFFWNLQEAYDATRVLSDGWKADVVSVHEEMRLRALRTQYERSLREEIPRAMEIFRRAEFALIVLDEDVPEARSAADGGVVDEEALQRVAHPVRVLVRRFSDHRTVVRITREVNAGYRMVVGAVGDSRVQAALERQANNCALAGEVTKTLGLVN